MIVSVIIPVRDGGDRFRTVLDAIFAQRLQDGATLEVIVADNASRDDSGTFARSRGARVFDVAQGAFSHGATRNEAFARATGSVLVFTVQDARMVEPRTLQTLVDAALADARTAAAFGRHVPEPAHSIRAKIRVMHDPAGQAEARLHGDGAHPPMLNNVFSAITREAAEAVARNAHRTAPFADIAFGEDMFFACEACALGMMIRYEPRAIVEHSHDRDEAYAWARAYIDAYAAVDRARRFGHANVSDTARRVATLVPATLAQLANDWREAYRLSGGGLGDDRAPTRVELLDIARYALAEQRGYTRGNLDATLHLKPRVTGI